MVEPLPQRCTGRDILQPRIHIERFLLHTARPETLDEDAPSICARAWFVGAFYADHDEPAVASCLIPVDCIWVHPPRWVRIEACRWRAFASTRRATSML